MEAREVQDILKAWFKENLADFSRIEMDVDKFEKSGVVFITLMPHEREFFEEVRFQKFREAGKAIANRTGCQVVLQSYIGFSPSA